jgi:hypothetical protein
VRLLLRNRLEAPLDLHLFLKTAGLRVQFRGVAAEAGLLALRRVKPLLQL